MKKIAIIGSGGSGKSTLAKQLGDILNLPVYHLDFYYWKPNWVPTVETEWTNFVEILTKNEEWIIDGNYRRTMDIRLREADTIIFLDYSTRLSLYRAVKRRIQYNGSTRPDMGYGCNEKIDYEFVKWIWNFRRIQRPELMKKLDELMLYKQIYIFTSPKQLGAFLSQLRKYKYL